jgi:dihydroorotate dehydrogenase
MYKSIIRPILFRFDPEAIHHFSFSSIKFAFKIPGLGSLARWYFTPNNKNLGTDFCGLHFKNPVGLAAGFDKNGELIDELANFGFGFIEVGTVTPKAQPGNDQPRLFRLPQDKGLINRMGFNNNGLEALIANLKRRKSSVLVGGNIGKNKITPNENATDDYVTCFKALFDYVDYFVVNVSSPNTPNLRDLQEKEPLTKLLSTLQNLNTAKAAPKPIFLKIAPDLTETQLDDIVDIIATTKIAGLIATNTTIDRSMLGTDKSVVEAIGMGGLSGKPVTQKATDVIAYINQKAKGTIPIMGVGGIYNGADAQEKVKAGAKLVQIYSGFIYEGPSIVKNICKNLA